MAVWVMIGSVVNAFRRGGGDDAAARAEALASVDERLGRIEERLAQPSPAAAAIDARFATAEAKLDARLTVSDAKLDRAFDLLAAKVENFEAKMTLLLGVLAAMLVVTLVLAVRLAV